MAEVEDGVVVDRLLDTPDRPAETPVTTLEATPAGTPPTAAERPPTPARAYGVAPDLSGTEWRTELPASPWYGSPPAAAAVACVGSRSGVATALDARSGETPWTHGFDVPLDLRRPAVADGVCPFGSSAGLVALAPDRTDGGDRRRQL